MFKIKKPAFFALGMAASLLTVTCATSALAASGQVSYNFVNVSVNGETKITAGQDITAANGQKVPSSILFTDQAGGKTNYLPIRTVSELLNVEIGYDSSSKTVLLGGQQAKAVPGRQWRRELNQQGGVYYLGPEEAGTAAGVSAPTWRVNWLPEGWKLDSVTTLNPYFPTAAWHYKKGGETLTLYCYGLSNGYYGENMGAGIDTAALRQDTQVQGRSADFYQTEENAILVWEDSGGTLLMLVLDGKMDKAGLERVANSATESGDKTIPEYKLGWVPDDSKEISLESMNGLVIMTTGGVQLTYSDQPLTAPDGTPETVKVKGKQAQLWAGDPNAKGETIVVNGQERELPAEARKSTLLWEDSDAGLTFRIQGELDRTAILHMAESVTKA